MNAPRVVRKYLRILAIVILPVFAGVSCLPAAVTPIPTPIIQIVQVNREVTVEVTRIVEVPVTVTPTFTPLFTATPTPSPTSADSPTPSPIPEPAQVTVLIHTQCLFGPDPAYMNKYQLLADSSQTVAGRNPDGSWVLLAGPDHKTPCWLKATLVKVDSGDIQDAQVTDPVLAPYSTLYQPPQAASAYRDGNKVTIFWQPVNVAQSDYNGYLVEALVCQSGQRVLVPTHYEPSFDKNNAIMAVAVTDEPGCADPSGARIYTVLPTAYSTWKDVVPWPAAVPSPGDTPTP